MHLPRGRTYKTKTLCNILQLLLLAPAETLMCKYELLVLQRTIQLTSVQQLLCRIASTDEEDNCEMRWVGYGLQSKVVKL